MSTNYDLIFVVVNWLTKVVHLKPAQIIDVLGLEEVFINLTVRYDLLDLIVL